VFLFSIFKSISIKISIIITIWNTKRKRMLAVLEALAVAEAEDVEKEALGPKQLSTEMVPRVAIGHVVADSEMENVEVVRKRLVAELAKDSVEHEMVMIVEIIEVIEMEREEAANEVVEVEEAMPMLLPLLLERKLLEHQCKVLETHQPTKAAEGDKEHSTTSRPGSTSTSTERGLFLTGMSLSVRTRRCPSCQHTQMC